MTLRALALVFSLSVVARADTPQTRFQRAANGRSRQWDIVHRKARLALEFDAAIRGGLRSAALEDARALLEEALHAGGADDTLRLDLGEVYEALHRHVAAIEVLAPLLARLPNSPRILEGLTSLGHAYARLHRVEEERDTYRRFLEIVTEDGPRSSAHLNLAEAEMHVGDVRDAVRSYELAYEEAARNNPSSATLVLAKWGLALAHDRLGDRGRALVEARAALALDPGNDVLGSANLAGSSVFFVPAWEKHWYLALATLSGLTSARGVKEQRALWKAAQEHWEGWVGPTEVSVLDLPKEQRALVESWLHIARKSLRDAKRETERVKP